MVCDSGNIRREGSAVLIEVPWELGRWAVGEPDVEIVNPDAPEVERLVRKQFVRKRIYFPDELDAAIAAHLAHEDNFVISMNGYSQVTQEHCRQYGIQLGAYEEACKAVLRETIRRLRTRFTAAQLRITSGASRMGVDLAIEEVAEEFNVTPLGFSCPQFMLWVADDELPVYVARSKDEYADVYIRKLDFLVATGGREHALQHDIYAACIYGKRIHFVDLLSMLSSTGTVPATIVDASGKVRVENAAAAMGRNLSFFEVRRAYAIAPSGGDKWDALFDNVSSAAVEVCREKMSPSRKFR